MATTGITKRVRTRGRGRKGSDLSCSLKATIGHKTPGVPQSGPYHVCLSESQKLALFGSTQPKVAIGCGTFACVWPARAGRVVKLTRDRDDAEGLKAAQGLDRVVKIFEARTLTHAGRDARTGKRIPIYAIVAERLTPLTKREQRDIAKPLERARVVMINRAKKHRGHMRVFHAPVGAESAELVKKVCAKTPGGGCQRFTESFFDAWAEMFRRGILWQDAHPGNVAMDAQRRWKAIDLGFSGTKRRTDIPALNGARRR